MKSITTLLMVPVLLISVLTYAGEGPTGHCNWLSDIEEARSEASSSEMPILISFSGSDWCIPCMRLDRDLFSTDKFMEFSHENLVLLKLDFPSRKKNLLSEEQLKHNEALAELYNKRGTFPLVVITDAEGNVKGTMDHPLTSADAYINSIQSVINR